ncbi:hypothetical protein KCG44_05845 [Pacificimonas sp. WHA3]|uniref:DUF2333 domain-containing protein n=1 Tax=Pacificimonas pallii TaxID=2827236 RepID=A0ABS6SEF7_9SPHN|nr:hypothetical protein [Pacificimonas pallii]MBV7256306.1 hypothetical protein [Pacificimonas pallii]
MTFIDNLRRKWLVRSLEQQEKRTRSRLPAPLAAMPRWLLALCALVIIAVFYWGILGWVLEDKSTDLTLRPSVEQLPPGGSVTVGGLAALGMAELDRGGWTPNDGWLKPHGFREAMPALQTGIHDVLSGVSAVLGRSDDDDLMDAAEDYAVPPTRGVFHGDFPFIGASAGSHIEDASAAYARFNTRLTDGEAARPSGAVDARALITVIGAKLADDVRGFDAAMLANADADPLDYQQTRGRAYASAILLRGIQSDFEPVLRERELTGLMAEAIETLDRVSAADPLILTNGDRTEQAYLLRSAVSALARIRGGLA